VTRFGKPLTGYATRILGDRERARDVVQDTFLRFHEAGGDVPPAAVKAWLYRVCRNRALDVQRHERRAVGLDAANEPSVEPRGERARILAELGQLLDDLPAEKREVLALRYREGRSYRQISERTGLSVSHVGTILHHTLHTLRGRVTLGAALILLVLTAAWWPRPEPTRAEQVVPTLIDATSPEPPTTPLEIEGADERIVESPDSVDSASPKRRDSLPETRHGFDGEVPPHLRDGSR
jgi:RNA polymerase sigma-70 factor (ECF subfamily)